MKGSICLAGSGPGDPGLLTLKALKRIRCADLIVYDYLCNPEHLRHAKPGAKIIGVGRGFRHKTLSQERINRLIVSAAKRGLHVVRLKGGDPYLFGRGGEEALLAVRQGIRFEVIPGVTSATACAAYAGIPLTHRDHNASVTFLTGHRADDKNLDSIPWEKIAGIGGTLVIYMGFYNLKKIASHLILAGIKAETPCAVIQWGSLPRQKSVSAPLGDIAKRVLASGLGAPSIILIGDVVSLRKKLNWYEKLPLFGRKILVTRASEKSGGFREKLEDLGAEVMELPMIEIRRAKNVKPLDRALACIADYTWVVFASVHGVRFFFERLSALGLDSRALFGVKFAVVGPETQKALLGQGIIAEYIPGSYDTATLLRDFSRSGFLQKGDRILLPRTHLATDQMSHALQKIGAVVTNVTAYETHCPKKIDADLKKRVLHGEADLITFTSASTAHHFVRVFGISAAKKIAKNTKILSIGPVTSKALKSYGIQPYRQAKSFTVDGLIQLLLRVKL